MSTDGRRGLGRGLSAIFSGDDQRVDDQLDLHARLVNVALSALTESVALALCGYLGSATSPEAGLTLTSPDLTMLDAGETYRLFAAVSRAEHLPKGVHPLILQNGTGRAVVTEGDTRGIFVFGSPDLTDEDAEQATRFCVSYGPVIHTHMHPATEAEQAVLVMDQKPDGAHAEVTVGSSVGFGSAAEPGHAVARAVLSAVGSKAKLVSVSEIRAKDGAIVLVAVNGDNNPLGMGAAPLGKDHHQAIAVATMRASITV